MVSLSSKLGWSRGSVSDTVRVGVSVEISVGPRFDGLSSCVKYLYSLNINLYNHIFEKSRGKTKSASFATGHKHFSFPLLFYW